ncbi:ArnT family glycosyltransferase [Granulicella cerasi]|uniref:ArnT family glycosyltransferase n=1 Tax=Granulicella cerasi TaxID=741063 RepID=A0ABW1Z5Q9_9BACT|nr:glycosyltransferase family 39 protein [Granulicella cerasi]
MSTANASTTYVRGHDLELAKALRLAVIFAIVRLLFQFALTLWTTHLGYGYFRDEFYYIACGRHLAWGYVDHGPVVAVQARLGELLFGDSVFGIRVLSAAAGTVMIFLTGILTWAFGGKRPAQGLAMLAVFLAPGFIGVDGYLSMNSFEPVFWMTSLLAIILVLQGRNPRLWWTVYGISSGLGLLNKPSMTFFLVTLGIGLLCTPQRRVLFTRWAALGIVLSLVIAAPNVVWQIHNHWPTLEFLRNGQKHGKNLVFPFPQFLLGQLLQLHPVNALVWLTGVVALLRAKSVKNMRWLGIAFLIFLPLMWKLHAKDYYLEPFYPALFAAGGVAWEHRNAARRLVAEGRVFALPILESLLVVLILPSLPMASPILPPMTWVRYADVTHFRPKPQESGHEAILPQFYADRFGWNNEVDLVLQAYQRLTPQEQQHVCIFASNYGEAGAIDFLGKQREPSLPPAISGHNSYWTWGMHGCDDNIVIALVGDTPEELHVKYSDVQLIGVTSDPLAMPFELHQNVYLLKHRQPSAPLDWHDERFYY